MSIKLVDTLEPMASFPIAMAENIDFADGKSLQEKYDSGKLVSSAEAPVKVTDGKISLDTVPIVKGGTGVTTQADINKAFINNLEIDSSDVTDGTEFVSSWASDNGFNETTEGAVNTPYRRKFIKVWGYIKDKISSVLGLTKDNYGGKANIAGFLANYASKRLTSGNIVPKDASEYGGMRKDVVTSSMTDSGRPGQDGHLLTMFWDSDGRWDAQLFLNCEKTPVLKARVKDNTADYGPWVDVITSNNIGSQTVAKANNADTVDDYHASDLWRSDGATWNPNANVTMTPSGNGSEWSFDFRDKNGATGSYWQVWDENKNTLLRVNADDGKVSAPYGFVGNLSGKADTAGTADVANALAYRSGITNTDTFQNVMNNDGKWMITDLDSGWVGSLYSFHAGGSQSGLMFRIRGGSTDIRNIEVNYAIDSNRFAGPWQPLIGRIPIGAPSSPQDGDIWIS